MFYSKTHTFKKCPFCNGDNITLRISNDKNPFYRVEHICKENNTKVHSNIRIEIKTRWFEFSTDAIEAWNSRANLND